jgi:CubicO group peptidase (beta-lactamase class C family)
MRSDRDGSGALQGLLDELRAKHGVVGATLGVLRGDAIETAASGLLNLDTRVECTPDSVFQIGSIGKIFTTTLIMQLVDEGRLELDDPVRQHLRDFTLADRDAARAITVRQLLNHTSGMDGDFFPADDPEGPSTASYVRKMHLLPNLYPPGRGPVTYCNAGFVTAGRIIEVLTGRTWPSAVMSRVVRPLGLAHAFARPHEALRYRCAMGHIFDPADMTKIRVAPGTYLSLSAAAAGSVLSMSVENLLTFARAHLADGRYGDGKRLLSEASARRMREPTAPVPLFANAGVTHWGLGWALGQRGD